MRIQLLLTSIMLVTQTLSALPSEESRKLTVTGSGSVFKPADRLEITIGVRTYHREVKKAISSNAEQMNDVLAALKKVGLSDREIQTGHYSITPEYTPPPQNPPANWQPTVAGYTIENAVNIRTAQLDLASSIIDTAGKEGANHIQNISFNLQNQEEAKSEAIALAIHQADTYANAAVREAGIRLGDIIELTINTPFVAVQLLNAKRFGAAGADTTPISPGDVEVNATVSLVYRIQPR